MPAGTRHRTSWFITLPIAAGAIAYLWLVFLPTAKAIRETRQEIRQKQDFISQSHALHKTLVQLEQSRSEVERFADQWRRSNPKPGELASLYSKIAHHARQSGATTAKFDPQPVVTLETIQRVPLHIDVIGSYANLLQMLAALERLPETIWIEELKFEKPRETGKDVKCELKLEVFAVESKKSG